MSELDKPDPPGDYDCCEGGCEPCVWDSYREAMRIWKEAQLTEKNLTPTPEDPT